MRLPFLGKGANMDFTVISKAGQHGLTVDIKRVAIAGYSGRDIEKMMEQVGQLEKENIKSPDYSELPAVYPVSPSLLTQDGHITVHSRKTSGEVEFLLLKHDGEYYVGLGSDHTDRDIESEDIQRSKASSPKPISPILWDYYDIKDHLDKVRMLSATSVDGNIYEYQEGTMADLLPPIAILNRVSKDMDLEDCLIFSGTIPLLRDYRYGNAFSCRLSDDELGREIELKYTITVSDT